MRMTIKDFKEGVVVFAVPTGNAARNWGGKPTEFFCRGAKRKYVQLSRIYDGIPSGYSENYCVDTGATDKAIRSGYVNNSGYQFFKSLADFDNYLKIEIRNKKLSQALSGYGLPKWLAEDTIERMYEDYLARGDE